MNVRSLLVVILGLAGLVAALTSQSTLTPKRGGDHVFYGAEYNHFLAQELAVGDFDGDLVDDIVTTAKWDDPETGGAPQDKFATTFACSEQPGILKDVWGSFLVARDGDTLRVCDFTGEYGARHRAEWQSLGWDSLDVGACDECYEDLLSEVLAESLCDSCYGLNLRAEDQGAAYVFFGGDWSGKGHDVNLAVTEADVMIRGRVSGGLIYNAMAAGDMDGDGKSELALGAPNAGAGEVYVIRGSDEWPNVIDLANSADFEEWVLHSIIGKVVGDRFGMGITMGDLNADNRTELIVAAPEADSEAGRVYVFYPAASIPGIVNLSTVADGTLANFAQVVYGDSAGDNLGVVHLSNTHPPHHGGNSHTGGYNPVGLAVGQWDEDNVNDLVIGAGHAASGAGAVYVLFGGGATAKLAPGRTIDLGNNPSGNLNATDIRIDGDSGMLLGAGVGFFDADGGATYEDLLIGAPTASGDGKSQRGNVYTIFGATRSTLTAVGSRVRDVGTTGHTNQVIYGEDANDQLGGHFSGGNRTRPLDIDDDGKNDIGIAGQKEMIVLFGQSSWPDTVDLATVLYDSPQLRVVEFQPEQYARSTTIRLANLDDDNHHDLVFGGYDSPGYSPGDPSGDSGYRHAGQMWVTKGQDLFRSGAVSQTTTWSGNIFVHGDLVVEDGVTLTISEGTDVWIWPSDPDSGDDVWPSYPLHFDTTLVEFRVYGNLIVDGAPGNPVRIQGWTMDGPASDEPDLWWGIHVHDGGAVLDHCEIRNARIAIQANAPVTITNSTIEHADLIGLSIAGADSMYADNLTMRDVGYIGVNALQGARVRLSDSDLSELGDYGVRAYSGAKLYVDNTGVRDADLEAISIEDENTFAKVENSVIENNYRGLRAEGEAVMVLEGTTVDESANYGIYSLYDATVDIDGCSIMNATAALAVFESNASLDDNLLRDSDVGLLSLQGSAPTVEGCDIIYNGIGVLAMQGGVPNLGTGGAFGNNEIHHSTTYNVSNLTTPDTLKAENNYWKNNTIPCWPVTSKINGLVDYMPSLCSPPSPVSSRSGSQGDVPARYALAANYPNPFNPTTTVSYEIPHPGGKVELAIYNVRGQLVRTLVKGYEAAGYHSLVWDGTTNRGETSSSGIYFLRMRAPGFEHTRKLLLLK